MRAGLNKPLLWVGCNFSLNRAIARCGRPRNDLGDVVDYAVLRGAAVLTSPVLGVPVGSISSKCTSSFATGQCSTPFGTMYICPGPRVTVRSRSWMSSTPFRTRKKSSVSSCLCQTNSPFTFTTMTSQLLNWATTQGDQCSENVASCSDKSILSLMDASDIVACEFTR